MIKERKYQKVSQEQVERCITWLQNKLQLRDWHLEVYYGRREKDNPSTAWTIMDLNDAYHHVAELWLDLEWCKEKNVNPYLACCHELLHVLIMGKCRIFLDDNCDADELICYGLQDSLYQEFCRETKTKLVDFQER